jgi:1,2-diacylglycerol 3-beta-glucosyltransferase
MTVLFFLDFFALAVAGIFTLYLLFLSIIALCVRRRTNFTATASRRFAILIPAHNEELSLDRTVRSLQQIEYPKELFDIVVIADNCSDATAAIGRRLGATVYERTNADLRGKGYALRWMFDILMAATPAYDAFIVIDADSVASANFLQVMNKDLELGARAIQCNDMVEPRAEAWVSEVIRFGFTLYNFVRPMGRKPLGFSAGIRGNGMCFSRSLLEEYPWNSYSLNEDLEYGLRLLANGITVRFAPEAIVHALMPTTTKNAESQRSRWERGRLPVIRTFTPKLLFAGIRHLSLPPFDGLIELLTPPFVNLFGGLLLMTVLHAALILSGFAEIARLTGLWALLVLSAVLHVLIGLAAARADRGLYKAIFYIPRYALWKILLYMKLSRQRRSDEWVRTTRDAEVNGSPAPEKKPEQSISQKIL